jgi:RNA polymerase sigma factor (TIGR02999 family)
MRTSAPQHPHGPPTPAPRELTDAPVAPRAGPIDQLGGALDALDRLVPLVYGELRRIAHRQLAAERAGHTLSTTGLVHEAYLKLADQTRARWADRAHFFAVAARAMRRILVDYARRHRALRRGGERVRLSLAALDEVGAGAGAGAIDVAARADELVALDGALRRLAALDERLARVVECRYFAGLTDAETALALGVTARTVGRDWVKAKGWLYQALRPDGA